MLSQLDDKKFPCFPWSFQVNLILFPLYLFVCLLISIMSFRFPLCSAKYIVIINSNYIFLQHLYCFDIFYNLIASIVAAGFLAFLIYNLNFWFQDFYFLFVTRRMLLFASLFPFDRLLFSGMCFIAQLKKWIIGFLVIILVEYVYGGLHLFSKFKPKCWFLYCVSLILLAVLWLERSVKECRFYNFLFFSFFF